LPLGALGRVDQVLAAVGRLRDAVEQLVEGRHAEARAVGAAQQQLVDRREAQATFGLVVLPKPV
jgi:hypothetical protein